jgi:hypothetical protein
MTDLEYIKAYQSFAWFRLLYSAMSRYWPRNKIEFNCMKESYIMTTLNININEKANLIWAIADKLTGPYKPHEYGEVILPLTVIRRFDCILQATKEAVVQKNKELNIAV